MSRPPRLDPVGARHHVMNRGARAQDIFLDDACCATFLDLLAELPGRFAVRVHAYALMPNHFHLLLECPVGGLPRAMQFLQSRYARWLNVARHWDGPVLRGRYKNLLVEDEAWWAHLLAYLHLNPVRAHLVPEPDRALWTSHLVYAGRVPAPDWLFTQELREVFGSVQAYLDYLWEVQVGREQGPTGFDPALLWLPPRPSAELRPAPPTAPGAGPVSEERGWAMLQVATGLSREALLHAPPGRAGNLARYLAMDWLPRATGMSKTRLARQLGVDPSVASRASRRVRAGQHREPLATWIERLDGLIAGEG